MPSFAQQSTERLSTCDPRLIALFEAVVEHFDCTVIEGHRNEERQNAAFHGGRSQLLWPNGKHNTLPSRAVDVAPWPIDWSDRERFTLFAGYVLGIARGLGIAIRWGGTWAMDWKPAENSFDDLVHFELIDDEDDE